MEVQPTVLGDQGDTKTNECLGEPIDGHEIRDRSNKDNSIHLNVNPKPLFPIFSYKKADINFTSSKTPMFAAKAKDKLNDVRPPNPRKKPSKASLVW